MWTTQLYSPCPRWSGIIRRGLSQPSTGRAEVLRKAHVAAYPSPLADPEIGVHVDPSFGSGEVQLLYWVLLNAVDALLTGLAMSLGATEANPILNLFAADMGIIGMISTKTLMGVWIGSVLLDRKMLGALRKLNFAMLGLVIYNMLVITHGM